MERIRTEEQDELAALVRQLLERRAGSQAVREAMESRHGYDAALWRTLCEQVGVAALPIPEEAGGAGFGLAESFVVLEELGRSLVPSPMLATTVATAALLDLADPSATGLLSRVAAGEVATLAFDEGDVLDGDTADVVLAVRDGALVHLRSPDSTWTPAMDPTLRLARVDLSGEAHVLSADPVGTASAVERARQVAVAGAAMLSVGTMQRGLDMTVTHAKERVQFGRQIGSFQALKHRMADLLVLVETSRSAAWSAAHAVAHHTADAARQVAVAGAYVGDAALRLAGEVVQLHGGIAITWEHDAHLVLKRAQALGQLFGQPHEHRARLVTGD